MKGLGTRALNCPRRYTFFFLPLFILCPLIFLSHITLSLLAKSCTAIDIYFTPTFFFPVSLTHPHLFCFPSPFICRQLNHFRYFHPVLTITFLTLCFYYRPSSLEFLNTQCIFLNVHTCLFLCLF